MRRRLLEQTKDRGNDAVAKKMVRAGKILERMVNQNSCFEIAHGNITCEVQSQCNFRLFFEDFRFYEDPSDEYKDFEGTLLPLWEFIYEKNKNLEITSLCWNPKYDDMFAAGFGSCQYCHIICSNLLISSFLPDNFYEQSEPGMVCVFSLKNPSYPEFLCKAPCGVMCIDVNPMVISKS